MATTLLGLSTDEMMMLMQENNEPAYRGKQLTDWIYRHGAHTFDDMANLPDSLRTHLAERYKIGRSQIANTQTSKDGTVKLLLTMRDNSQIETVGLPYTDRFSCCISTQVGCTIGCIFCATGSNGYSRNLTAGEIVDQVLTIQETTQNQSLRIDDRCRRINHVIFMGMGEPLLNYDATIKALHLLNTEVGVSMRHLTISTVGFVPGILRLMQEKLQLTLAVSLHAPTDALRNRIIPGMAKWNIAAIMEACHKYSQATGRRVTFEYCLLDRVNDDIAEAIELSKILHGFNCHVNLIAYNPVAGLSFNAPRRNRIRDFREILEKAGIPVTQRMPRGSDIDAACGQLQQRIINPISIF
jgi:23S rRNA (adenine2503-C2)-methyltransferase